ncbi:MAG: CotH kinase family protein [Ruminococcus sp.]|nr:CotH kinase family protein [Ruminococcus sp.]
MLSSLSKRTAAGILCLSMLAGCLSAAPAADAAGTLSINEVCSKNTTMPAPDGGLYDYVELINPTGSEIDLSGYGLSDKDTKPFRFTVPAGTSIAAGGRLLIYCDATAAATDPTIAPFGMSASGETITLTAPDGTVADTITFGALASDTAYGQYPDGSGEYYVMACTPGEANLAPEGSDAVRLPEFSQESGFYGSSFQLNITAPEGCTVYYTTDGSDPTAESQRYEGAITVQDMSDTPNVLSARTDISASDVAAPTKNIDKAAVIRAVAVDSQGRVSAPVTKTYFIGRTNGGYYKEMKVISLVTDPENLFNYDTGIYCKGKVYDEENGTQPGDPQDPWGGPWGGFGWGMKQPWEMAANYTQKGRVWEREATMQVFDSGSLALDQNVGIRIKGAASRNAVQKSFNVYARADYGNDVLDFDFFSGNAVKEKNGKTLKKFSSVVIRNGGNDVGNAYFRDSINQRLIKGRDMATQATDECILFIDGEFWGVYQLTEKITDDFINDHFGIKKSDVALIKNGELEEGTDQDLADWNALIKDTADGALTYSQLSEKLDMQSFMDYFAAQIYWDNDDWPQNNVAAWRTDAPDDSSEYSDGRWRMFLFDTESGQGLYGSESKSVNADQFSRISYQNNDLCRMFGTLLKDDQFRLDFARTYMDIANYNMDTAKTSAQIGYFKDNFRQQILDTYERFYSDYLSGELGTEKFETEYNTITDFYQRRYEVSERHLKQHLSLSQQLSSVTVNNDGTKGSVKLNTIPLEDSLATWTGKYHSDYDMEAHAEAKEGYRFDHWEISGGSVLSTTLNAPDVLFKVDSDVVLTAVYEAGEAPTDPTTEPQEDLLYGDANADGKVDLQDAVAILQYSALPKKYPLTEKGEKQADVDGVEGLSGKDALVVQQVDAKLIDQSELPLGK